MNSARHVGTGISCTAQKAYDYISSPANLPSWASGLSSSIHEVDGQWVADSPMGKVIVKFAPKNDFGILDHEVTLASGIKVSNPFRVIENEDCCELVFTVFHRDGISELEFLGDVRHVEKDLLALKKILET